MSDIDLDKEAGEFAEVPADDPDVEEVEGGAMVKVGDAKPIGQSDFYANLVDDLDPQVRSTLATKLLELIELDKKAREKRDKQYAEGIKRTGLGDEAPGGAQFDGASRVVHPMMVEASVDFESRSMKELFPANGPAKDFIPGTPTKEKVEKARRKVKHLNWQLTVQMKEFRSELEQALTQTPLGGAAYIKLGWDAARKRPTAEFVPIDDIFLPFAATNFYSAERKTHRQTITRQEFERRVARGMYKDISTVSPALPEQTAAAVATDKVEGRAPSSYNEDGLREVFETCCSYDLEIEPAEAAGDAGPDPDGERLCPYIVSIDASTREVLAVYRNWEEDDKGFEEMTWIIELPFVPWRGAYPIGLTQMIGGLSGAATGALRALLDSALINNLATLLKLKGGSKGGQTQQLPATGVTEIEGSLLADDIRKTIMPVPFNPPSVVLFQLLGFLVDAGRGVVRTTFENLAETGPTPVGTTLAMIEQGLTVYSAIHGRLHNAMARLLSVLCRINYMYLDDQDLLDETGELLARRSDYEGPDDVVPVSDPNIFSETQRFAQVQAVVARSDAHPEIYDQRAVEERLLERLKVPDYEELLRKIQEPKPLNAVNENLAAVAGQPLAAFPEQDHLAHLQVHLDFIGSPFLGSSPLVAPAALPKLLDHLKEHIGLWYVTSIYEVVKSVTRVAPERLMDDDPAVSSALDKLLATASQRVVPAAPKTFERVPPVVGAAMALLKAIAPPLPQDPTVAAAAASAAETQRKAAADQLKAQGDHAKALAADAKAQAELQVRMTELQNSHELALAEARRKDGEARTRAAEAVAKLQDAEVARAAAADLEQLRQASEDARKAAELATRELVNTQDNETAKLLASWEMAFGEKTALSTGTGVNPNP